MGYILTDTIPAYELVADVTVSVATTSVTIGGLNFGKSDDLLLVSDFYNAGGSYSYGYLHCNGNTTNTNYYAQRIYGINTTVGGDRSNYPFAIGCSAGLKSSDIIKIKLTNNGYFVYQSCATLSYSSPSSNLGVENRYGTSTFTASAINTLTITASVSNSIGIGSRFQLYRRKATLLADTTISGSAVTSVNFTGLNLTSANEVMLVSDVVNTSAESNYFLYKNADYSDANYYSQFIQAFTTNIYAGRTNNARFMYSNVNTNSMAITQIKVSNNGNFVFQSYETQHYVSPYEYPLILNFYTSSTNTLTSITSLRVASGASNAIGIGSRFQLYLMK